MVYIYISFGVYRYILNVIYIYIAYMDPMGTLTIKYFKLLCLWQDQVQSLCDGIDAENPPDSDIINAQKKAGHDRFIG